MATALITGASMGIGAEFAKALAARKLDLILTARSQDKLETLAKELGDRYGIKTHCIPLDLSVPGAAAKLRDSIADAGLTVDWLINNAGFGDYGAFADGDRAKSVSMVNLNITALMELTYDFLPAMVERKSGTIINLASIAGYQPLPYMALYAATKAFVLNFSEALWAENKDTGVRILGLCPGPTSTEFFKAAEFPVALAPKEASAATPETVVAEALEALEAGQANCVTGGFGNKALVNSGRFFPRGWLAKSIGEMFKPANAAK
ncbi:MAG: SDR family oxidoreductase [Cyanobacteria bacterium P01_F01_bin.153]